MIASLRVMASRRFLLPLLVLLAILGSGCLGRGLTPSPAPAASSTPKEILPQTSAGTPTSVLEQPTSSPEVPAIASQALPPGFLFNDDFSNPNMGFPQNQGADSGFYGYHEPGYYHIQIAVPHERTEISIPGQRFTDFTLEGAMFAEPSMTASEGDFRYGLVARRSGNQYYAFTLSPVSREWAFFKRTSGQLEILKEGVLEAVAVTGQPNRLRIDARGPDFYLHINDAFLGLASDGDYPEGEAGMYAETFDSSQVHVHFDTLSVRQVVIDQTQGLILYNDDFRDPSSGWPQKDIFDNAFIGYHEPDYFHVQIQTPNEDRPVSIPGGKLFEDFTAETAAFSEPSMTAAEGDYRYGLLVRRSGRQFYALMLSPVSETWSFLKSSADRVVTLGEGTLAGLAPLGTPNRLRIDARGPDFFLHINGEFLGLVTDNEYGAGEVGLYVETFDASQVHIHYDSITVRQVESPEFQCQVITKGVNLRAGPGRSNPLVAGLAQGALVQPTGRSADGAWLQVRLPDQAVEGWVTYSERFLACQPPASALPVVKP